MASPASPVLSESQLALLAAHGEERTADVGDVLFTIGDVRYPFIAILSGEAAVLDASGREIIRHGASGFLGEMNLLSGQTVYLTAVVTQPLRYIAVDRDDLAAALVRRRSPVRAPAVGLHGASRGAATGGGRDRDRRATLVGADPADRRLRPAQPPALHLARS